MKNHTCALLIGVDSYRAFDPTGRHDLPGSVNDVRAWWKVCLALGLQPENIRVLASPKPEASAFPGAMVDEATHDKILAGASWLAGKLHHHPQRAGLLTYSGHGDHTPGDLALCPTDTTPGDATDTTPTSNLVQFATLSDIFHSEGHSDNLTIVLDCCYAGAAAKKAFPLAMNRRELPAALVHGFAHRADARPLGRATPLGPVPVGGRMLMACELGQVADQAEFMGEFHGAFTWALTSALLQWATVREGDHMRLDLSYGRARAAAAELLRTLEYDQKPLLSPPGAAGLAMFQTGDVPKHTSDTPDGPRVSSEFDPGTLKYVPYALTCSSATSSGYVDAIGSTSYSSSNHSRDYEISASSEYWLFPGDLWSGITGAASHWVSIEFTPGSAANFPSSGPLPNFSNVTPVLQTSNPVSSLTWTAKEGSLGPTLVFCDGVSIAVGFQNVVLSSGTFTGVLDWWYMGPSAPTSPIIPSGSNTILSYVPDSSYATSATSGNYWWHAQATVSTVTLP